MFWSTSRSNASKTHNHPTCRSGKVPQDNNKNARMSESSRTSMRCFNWCWTEPHNKTCRHEEPIKYRALKFAYNDFNLSYDVLRDKADVPPMYVRRLRVMMTEMYTISNDLWPKYIHDLFRVRTSKHYLRNSRTITQPKLKTVRYGMNSFMYKGAKIWNTLNNDVKGADNIKEFTKLINTSNCSYYPTCNCSYCKLWVLRRILVLYSSTHFIVG